jgi:hypothetical protein
MGIQECILATARHSATDAAMIPVLLHCLHGGARHRSEMHFAHLLLLERMVFGR